MKDCDSYKGKFTDYLMNSFDPEERKKLEEHLASCLDCRKEFEEVAGIWNLMGEIPVPEPSPGMREGFETMMAAYRKQLVSRKSFSKWLHDLFVFKNEKILLKPAFCFLLLLTGLAAG
jgi:predicted anti-sigma-YlaC factor YlaD